MWNFSGYYEVDVEFFRGMPIIVMNSSGIRDRSFITSQGGAVVSEESGKIKFLPLHNNPK